MVKVLLVEVLAVGASPLPADLSAGAVWATSYDGGSLLRLDPRRLVVTQTVDVGHGPAGLAIAAGVGKISWGWVIGAIVGIAAIFGSQQIVAWIRSMFGV